MSIGVHTQIGARPRAPRARRVCALAGVLVLLTIAAAVFASRSATATAAAGEPTIEHVGPGFDLDAVLATSATRSFVRATADPNGPMRFSLVALGLAIASLILGRTARGDRAAVVDDLLAWQLAASGGPRRRGPPSHSA